MTGQSIITALGLKALRDASLHNRDVVPRYFKYSSDDIELKPQLESKDIDGWIEQDIDLYQVIDENTIEFICDVKPTEAKSYVVVCGLYLEDGTLFMIAKPPYPFPPQARQTLKIQFVFQNASNVLNFKYLSFSEEEQSLASLDTTLTLGNQTIESAEEEGLNRKRVKEISEEILYIKERTKKDKQDIDTLFNLEEEQSLASLDTTLTLGNQTIESAEEVNFIFKKIEELQLCILENSLSFGVEIMSNSKEMGLLKK